MRYENWTLAIELALALNAVLLVVLLAVCWTRRDALGGGGGGGGFCCFPAAGGYTGLAGADDVDVERSGARSPDYRSLISPDQSKVGRPLHVHSISAESDHKLIKLIIFMFRCLLTYILSCSIDFLTVKIIYFRSLSFNYILNQ